MMAKLLNGKAVSDMLTEKLIEEVKLLKEKDITPISMSKMQKHFSAELTAQISP